MATQLQIEEIYDGALGYFALPAVSFFSLRALNICMIRVLQYTKASQQTAKGSTSPRASGEPGRTRTSNPLISPESLCSWLFLHFLARRSTVFDGVWRRS